MSLRQMIYISRAVGRPGPDTLDAIGKVSRMRNHVFGVTGLLLFGKGYYMQLLEGPPDCVGELYNSILKDPRHNDSDLIIDRPSLVRLYPNWSMGIYNLDADEGTVDISRIRTLLLDSVANPLSIRRNIVLAFEQLRHAGPDEIPLGADAA